MRHVFVGDIQGCLEPLDRLLGAVDFERGTDRLMPPSEEGDVIAIANAGAYGHVMSSHYNMRPPAKEIVI